MSGGDAGLARTLFRRALDHLGFVWDVRAYRQAQILRGVEAFRAAHGHTDVPAAHTMVDHDGSLFHLGAAVQKCVHGRRADLGTAQSPTAFRTALEALDVVVAVNG